MTASELDNARKELAAFCRAGTRHMLRRLSGKSAETLASGFRDNRQVD